MNFKAKQLPLSLTLCSCISFGIATYVSYTDQTNLRLSSSQQASSASTPQEIAQLKQYDSRTLDLVTPAKTRTDRKLSWAYANSDVVETNIIKQGLSPNGNKIELGSEYLFYAAKLRNASFNLMKINENDIAHGINKIGTSPIAEQAYSVWSAPIYNNLTPEQVQYVPPSFNMVQSDIYVGGSTDIPFKPTPSQIDERTLAMKQGIAQYGALSLDAVVQPGLLDGSNKYYNNNNDDPNTEWATRSYSVIGWNDDIQASQFKPIAAKRNGGWLVKSNFLSPDPTTVKTNAEEDAYFYLSYDSLFSSCIGYQFETTPNYQNNYHWDVGEPDKEPSDWAKKENAAIFPVEKAKFNNKEYLQAVGVSMVGKNIDLDLEVFVNVTGVNQLDPKNPNINPKSGTSVLKQRYHFDYGGTKTIKLPKPIELTKKQYFSVVAKVSSTTNEAYISLASDPTSSTKDMTYANVNGKWVNGHDNYDNSRTVARIRAFTSEEPQTGVESTDLDDAVIELNKTSVRYGDDQNKPQVTKLMIGDKILNQGDYEVIYGTPVFDKIANQTHSDSEAIGHCNIIVRGKGSYSGEQSISYDVIVGIAPSLGGYGWYTNDYLGYPNVINIIVDDTQTTYGDIKLPPYFYWNIGSDTPVDRKHPASITYRGKDARYYKFIKFENRKEDTHLILHPGDTKPPHELPPIIEDPNSQLNPALDLTKATITIDYPKPLPFRNEAIEPRVLEVRLDSKLLAKDVDYSIEYKNNKKPGTAQVIIYPVFNSPYWGQAVKNFKILNPDGTDPDNPDSGLTPPSPDPGVLVPLQSVQLQGINMKYKVGDTLLATVVLEPSNANHITYDWYVGGEQLEGEHFKTISFTIEQKHINKTIYAIAKQQGGKQLKTPERQIVSDINDVAPKPPQIPIESVYINLTSGSYYTEGEKVYATAVVYPSELSKDVTYEWSIVGGSSTQIYNNGTSSIYFTAQRADDRKRLRVTATYKGKKVTREVTLVINPKTPELNGVSIRLGQDSYTHGDTIYASASVWPSELSYQVSCNWTIVDSSTSLKNSSSSSISFKANSADNGKRLRVTARYNGRSVTDEIRLNIKSNSYPQPQIRSIKINLMGNGLYHEGDKISATAIVDPKELGSKATYEWTIIGSSTPLFNRNTSTVNFDAMSSDSGKYLRVTAWYNGISVSDEIPLSIISNATPPTAIDKIEINLNNGGSFTEGQIINAEAIISPNNLSSVSYQWELLNSSTVIENSKSRSISFIAKKEDDGKKLRVTARYNGQAFTQEVALIINAKPTLNSVAIINLYDSYTEGELIQPSAKPIFSDDPKHDRAVTYRWTIPETGELLGSGKTLNMRALMKYNNKLIQVSATYDDKTVSKSAILKISNQASVLPDKPDNNKPQASDKGQLTKIIVIACITAGFIGIAAAIIIIHRVNKNKDSSDYY